MPGITAEKVEPLNPEVQQWNMKNRPIVEMQLSRSKDGKYLIHKTIIPDIKLVKPAEIFEEIFAMQKD